MLTDYKVEWEVKDQVNTRNHQELNPTLTSYTVRGLSPSTKYTIYVSAQTSKGYGPAKSADVESGVPPGRSMY